VCVCAVLNVDLPPNMAVNIDSQALADAAEQHVDDDEACVDDDDDDDTSASDAFARSTDADRRHFYEELRCEYGYQRDHGGGGQRDRDRRRQRTADNQRLRRCAARLIATDAAELYEGTGECVASSSANAWCD